MQPRVYLDWNATAPLRSEARDAVVRAMDICGNPSSVHAEGRKARHLVEDARAAVAKALGAQAEGIVFVSGGTEANATALVPGWTRGRGGKRCERLIVSAIEHPSVLAGGSFAPERVARAPVTKDGIVDLDALQSLVQDGEPPLVSLMLANNETGAIQPVSQAAALVHAAGGILHVDAVQALGRIPLDVRGLGADLVSVSAHKIGGPKGVGALAIVDLELRQPAPLLKGGGQERNRRAGTENVAGIAGFGVAAEIAGTDPAESAGMQALRDRLEAGLAETAGVTIFSQDAPRLPNTTLFAMAGMRAETAVIAFDLEGVAVSSGAACSSGKVQPSHVLTAMGVLPELVQSAIRISLGHATKEDDIDRALEAWIKLSGVLRKAS
jgi:cysteine desulfurase